MHSVFSITYVTFLHLFLNKTLLFYVFSYLVVCGAINEEKREIDRFIQLNSKIQKIKQIKSIYSNPEVLLAILSEEPICQIR